MDSEGFLVDHVALVLDPMDINNANDFELIEKESKQLFGSAVSSITKQLPSNQSQAVPLTVSLGN